jgi:hypothetical protein
MPTEMMASAKVKAVPALVDFEYGTQTRRIMLAISTLDAVPAAVNFFPGRNL